MICTWLTMDELKRYIFTSNNELNEVLKEVREKTDNKFYVSELTYPYRKRLRKMVGKTYTVYADLGNGQFHVINFANNGDSSICINTSALVVINYFYGVLTGIAHSKQEENK